PMYQVTREEDINVANGDSFVPQVPPPACAGALHTVDVDGIGTDGYAQMTLADPSGNGGGDINVPASTPVDNAPFVDMGGSPDEGKPKPLCDTKLVRLSDRKSIAPGFNLFTDVPLPGRFWGLLVDDLNFSSDPKSLGYGEKMGIGFAPVGVYDYTNRLITTVESDYNGLFDVLLPSTNRINCPSPSGVCANLYRFVGNDPGVPGRLNTNYNPLYRTIAAEFEALPGLTIPADLAPTQVAVGVQIPGSQTLSPVNCALEAASPQLYAIDKPYIYTNEIGSLPTFTLSGAGFGASQGAGSVKLDATNMTIVSWNDTQIQFRLPTLGIGPNPYRLSVTANNGQRTVNGLTFHVISPGAGGGGGVYNPTLFIVSDTTTNPDTAHANGRWFKPSLYTDGNPSHAIQNAIEAASSAQRALIVVYPNHQGNNRVNPRGAYYENLVIHSPVKLQGVGPGSPDGSVPGTVLDGSAFGGDTALADDWRTLVGGLTWQGNPDVSEGQAIYLLATGTNQFTAGYPAGIDGIDIRGGDQMGFPGNLNAIFGGYPGPVGGPNAETQGGAIFANAYIRNLQITNNVIQNNGGTFGAIRIGTPNLAAPFTNNENDGLRVANNRIIANGGTNLAGAIGLFNGADAYEIAGNDFCGNFSAEYGGAISHYGLSSNGSIHDNRIYFNRSYDEGAGIMIAGELPADPNANYGTANGAKGAGAVNIFNNLIQANLSDDDGGGIRFLMAGNFPFNVYNNMIANNTSTHEGGGVALDDAPNVRFYHNTVMKNVTTATAITSDGQPAPAGLSTGQNSAQL
ncbi:MAG TPA: IPT/TIG domain-containing protein, partial [Roseiflexaceae bacterium]|nr:IPT/TIG domain-containing protein [Roseiflexaceae bacterium]